jgi:hypothetical protein
MKTGRFLQKELIYSTLETYFIQELGEHQATTDVAANEEVTNYPSSVKLINAVKVYLEELKRIRWIPECCY